MGATLFKAKTESIQDKLKRHGVLLPPSFGILGPHPSQSDRWLDTTPSYWEYLLASDLSTRILREYYEKGVWLDAYTTTTKTRTSLTLDDDDTNHGTGRLVGQIKGHEYATLRADTSGSAQIAVVLPVLEGLMWLGNVNNQGKGWIGSTLDVAFLKKPTDDSNNEYYYQNSSDEEDTNSEIKVKLGAWVPFESVWSKSTWKVSDLNGYAAVKFLGTTTAVETRLPLDDWRPASRKSYFTIDLNPEDDGPPIQVTLSRTDQSSAIAISQIFTFDRYQFNLLEDRAPKVRNTVGWTCKMERSEENTNVSVGVAWQLNRNIAVKAKWENGNIMTAFLFKQWAQPRLAFSVLHKYDFSSHQIVGIGVELETGRRSSSQYDNQYPPPSGADPSQVPETKATLPSSYRR